MNGEHFAVMGGTGFDALMIKDADETTQGEVRPVGYVRATSAAPRSSGQATVELDGRLVPRAGDGVLVGNVGTILGGITAFADASPTEAASMSASSGPDPHQWVGSSRGPSRGRRAPRSSSVDSREDQIELNRKIPWQVDGGDRGNDDDSYTVRCRAGAVAVCRPRDDDAA